MYKPTSEIVIEEIRRKKNMSYEFESKEQIEASAKSFLYKDKETLFWDNEVRKNPSALPSKPNKIPNQYSHMQFAELLANTIHQINELSKNKGEEYAGYGDDRLINFRDLSKELSIPIETVWAVYAKKHWNAIMTYIHEIQNGLVPVTRLEPITGRIDDLIVYCILLKAMAEEREAK